MANEKTVQAQTPEKAEYNTMLTRVNQSYMPMIERQLQDNGIEYSEYAKACVLNAIGAINTAMETAGTSWNDTALDTSNVTQTLQQVASLQLNASANPSECYFQIRNVKNKDGSWKKKVEWNVQGAGNDAILSRFGRDVKKVHPVWLVRENDEFVYPKFKGLDMTPPEWTPTGKGDVVRVVYPIQQTDNTLHFYIGEREDVAKNLIAHINNNLMNETFGICADRYKATAAEKEKIAVEKQKVIAKAKELGLKALDDPELQKYISPAWTEPQSRESMLIRKMQNNVVKKIPKDFGNPVLAETYNEATDDTYVANKQTIAEHTAIQDVEFKSVPATTAKIDMETGEVIEQAGDKPSFVD